MTPPPLPTAIHSVFINCSIITNLKQTIFKIHVRYLSRLHLAIFFFSIVILRHFLHNITVMILKFLLSNYYKHSDSMAFSRENMFNISFYFALCM